MESQSALKRQSLITNESRDSQNRPPPRKIGIDTLAVFILIGIMLLLILISMIRVLTTDDSVVVPVRISIPWFVDRPLVMQLGTSRVFEPNLYSGYDNRTLNNFVQVTQREIQWSVEPAGIVTVDMYGRVNAIKEGECKIKLRSKAVDDVTDERTIQVVRKRTDIDNVPKRVINFKGQPANVVRNLQKLVERMSAADALKDPNVPQSVKYAIEHPKEKFNTTVLSDNINWTIMNYTVDENSQYILRTDLQKKDEDKDKLQYFIGDRYIPDAGTTVVMIQNDGNKGIWVVGASGNITHIKMVSMSHREKAELMNLQTEKYVIRQGLASGAAFDGVKWVPEIADNDGLWTSMYGAGELMKYSVLKQSRADAETISKARTRALNSLKAVLLIANVAGRQGTLKAKIRHLNNTRIGNGVNYRKQYLLAGKPNTRDTYSGVPSDGNAFYGVDAGTNLTGDFIAGRFKYSQLPYNKEDWAQQGEPATTERNLEGFMSRTFVIPAAGPPIPSGGLFFKRSMNSTHTVLSGAHTLYDYTDNDHPNLDLGNKPIPEILKSILNIDGVQYNASDLVYKGDTSTDEVIGHLFIYKIAYDILDDSDNEEKQLKELIRETMRNFCQHLINNGHQMVDATGQAAKWTKLYKEFLGSDYTIQDGVLKTIQLLMSFKVAYYVTGERKWKDEYDLLTKDSQFRYIDMFQHVWSRWVWAFTKCDDSRSGLYRFNTASAPSEVEVERHVLYSFHFSDEEEAYLAYYLAFQLEEDPQMREQYRKGINAYWHSISKSQNPLWYYIYQLSKPETPVNDSFNQDLRETAAWQLSRHMVDTTEYQAFIKGSRDDVIFQGDISVNPRKIVGKRVNTEDQKYINNPLNKRISPEFNPNNIYEVRVLPADQRSIHKFNGATFENIDGSHNKNSIQPSTTFTLPYWLGVYHGLIKLD